MTTLAEVVNAMPDLAGLGSAGLMGAMWLWERKTSRLREQQLDEAHARVLANQVQLDQVILLVKSNTEALTRLCDAQERLLGTFSHA